MSVESDRLCRTCKNFAIPEGKHGVGECVAKLPVSLISSNTWLMGEYEGKDCPAWEPKQ